MIGPVRTALAVLVITGWAMALVWLSMSVAQIAVERTIIIPTPTTTLVPAVGNP